MKFFNRKTFTKRYLLGMLFLILVGIVNNLLCVHLSPAKENPFLLATSIVPLANLTKEIAGDKAEVTWIIPPGSDPHTFELKPQDMIRLQGVKLMFIVGWDFESSIRQLLSQLSNQSTIVEVNKGINPIYYASGEPNPHIWLSTVNANIIARNIAQSLSDIDPQNKEYYFKNLQLFTTKVEKLHDQFLQKFHDFPHLSFISLHPSWSYLARDFGFQEIGIVEEGPYLLPSPRKIKDLIQKAKEKGTKLIFADKLHNPKIAETLAQEIGGKVIYLEVLGSPEDSYWEFLKRNLELIYQALSENEKNRSGN